MERLRAIANPDELDPSFSVPCRRCAGLLQEGNRFCLFCFEDQLAPVAAAGEARSKIALKDALAVGDEARAAEGFDFVDTVQPDAAGLIGIDPSLRDELQADDGKWHWAARFARPRHAAIGAVPVLVLLALVFPELGRIGVDDRSAIAKPQVPRVAVEPLQAPSVPHVEPLQPQAQPQPQPTPLPDARETFSALGLGEAAASRPPLPKESPQPVVSTPAVSAAAAADEKTCSDTLAALGLCPQK